MTDKNANTNYKHDYPSIIRLVTIDAEKLLSMVRRELLNNQTTESYKLPKHQMTNRNYGLMLCHLDKITE